MRRRRRALAPFGAAVSPPPFVLADGGAAIPPAGVAGASRLFEARVRDIWRFIRRQRAAFWLVNLYLFFEYVRPQSIYPVLAFFPWSMVCVALAFGATLMEGGRGRRWTAVDVGMVLFTGVVLLSSAMAYDPGYSFRFENISLYLSWLLMYYAISTSINTEQKFFVFVLAFLLYNLKMSQHVVKVWVGMGFGFSQWAAVGAPGWFQNPGELAIEMVVFLPLSFLFYRALRAHWSRAKGWFFLFLPFSALVAIAAASSRGAQLAAGVVGLWLLLKSRYKVRGVLLAVVTALAVYLALPAEQRERFSEMGEDKTSLNRLVLWEHGIEIAGQHPVLGIGYKNWIPYYRAYYVAGGQLPHNIFVEAGAELGYTGLGVLLFLIGASFHVNYRTRRLARRDGRRGTFPELMAHGLDAALLGYLVAGFFVTVLYYPFLWVNLAMTVALHGSVRNRAPDAALPGAAVPHRRRGQVVVPGGGPAHP